MMFDAPLVTYVKPTPATSVAAPSAIAARVARDDRHGMAMIRSRSLGSEGLDRIDHVVGGH